MADVFLQFAKVQLIEERIISAQIFLSRLFALLGLTVFVAFAAWLVEHALIRTPFAHWTADRWYVPLGICVIAAVNQFQRQKQRQREHAEFFALSSPIRDFDGLKPNTKLQTGGVRFQGSVLGPVTISVDSYGLGFWQQARIRTIFPWSRIEKVHIREIESQHFVAEVRLQWERPLPPEIVIPWAREITRYVPNAIRL